MKLLIHSQIPTVQPLEFGNEYVFSSHILLVMRLFIHAGIKFDQLIHVSKLTSSLYLSAASDNSTHWRT